MSRRIGSRRRWPGELMCPVNEGHGPLVELRDGSLYCPHAEHDGRPKTHPDGPLGLSPNIFTLDQGERRVAA